MVGGAAITVLALLGSARGLVLCTTPDGKTYAGDKPPEGCKVKADYPNTPDEAPAANVKRQEAPADSSFEAGAITERRRIEDEINRQADSLSAARVALDQLDRSKPGYDWWNTPQFNNYWANRQLLQTKESEARIKIDELQRRFDGLTERVRAHNNGALPSTCGSSLNCPRCP